jgi:hypothetical protein
VVPRSIEPLQEAPSNIAIVPTAEEPIGPNADEPTQRFEFDSHALAPDRQRLEHGSPAWCDATELQEELLQARDELIAAEAQLGEAVGRIRVLETELGRYHKTVGQLDRLARSPVWRCQRLYERLRGRAGRVRAVVLGKAR